MSPFGAESAVPVAVVLIVPTLVKFPAASIMAWIVAFLVIPNGTCVAPAGSEMPNSKLLDPKFAEVPMPSVLEMELLNGIWMPVAEVIEPPAVGRYGPPGKSAVTALPSVLELVHLVSAPVVPPDRAGPPPVVVGVIGGGETVVAGPAVL